MPPCGRCRRWSNPAGGGAAGRRSTARTGSTWPGSRPESGLADRAVLRLRPAGGEEVPDVPGDLQAGGRSDPCGAVVGRGPIAGWRTCSTDPDLSAAAILETVADRSALEQVFHDVKEVHGAGQQQLRHVWANVGAWNLIGWWHTLVELWAWDRPASRSCDRSDSPWDRAARRPSHANRCQGLRQRRCRRNMRRSRPRRACPRKSGGSSRCSAPRRMRLTVLGKCSQQARCGIYRPEVPIGSGQIP